MVRIANDFLLQGTFCVECFYHFAVRGATVWRCEQFEDEEATETRVRHIELRLDKYNDPVQCASLGGLFDGEREEIIAHTMSVLSNIDRYI